MRHTTHYALLGTVLICLAGCGGTADALGLGRNPPDEFAVVDRPPLSLPPDFDLRPPRPGAARPQEVKMTSRASQTVFGSNSQSNFVASRDGDREKSDSEKALLSGAGAAKADSGIRDVIDREASQKVTGSTHLVDEILWWRDPAASGTTVDANAEAERIRAAKEKGESVSSGATPVIERDKSGWLGL